MLGEDLVAAPAYRARKLRERTQQLLALDILTAAEAGRVSNNPRNGFVTFAVRKSMVA